MKSRVLTALGLIPIVLGALFCANPWPVAVLATLVAWLGSVEIGRMLGGAKTMPPLQCLILLLGIPFVVSDPSARSIWLMMGVAAFVAGILTASAYAATKKLPLMGGIGSGFWVTGGLICLLSLHQTSQPGGLWFFGNFALMALVPLWLGDSAAYFVGRKFGKHKLAPSISPKKSVEGGVANLFFSIGGALVLGHFLKIGLAPSLLCGISAGILGQAGDLFESWVKRSADLKDSGSILPGHGGIMDRIDSVLFTAPAVALILTYLPR